MQVGMSRMVLVTGVTTIRGLHQPELPLRYQGSASVRAIALAIADWLYNLHEDPVALERAIHSREPVVYAIPSTKEVLAGGGNYDEHLADLVKQHEPTSFRTKMGLWAIEHPKRMIQGERIDAVLHRLA